MHSLIALLLLFTQSPSSQSGNPSGTPAQTQAAPQTAAQRPAESPEAAIAEQRAAIAKLDKAVGTWRGSGWIMMGPQKRSEFNQTETIQKKLGDTVLLVEGNGRDVQDPNRTVHDALAVLSYDTAKKQYLFSTYANGRHLEAPAEVNENGYVWGFDMPYGRVRFTLDFSGGKWHEVGEISRDGGKTWFKNFEMTLTRE
jgi:hypothetical protein